MEEQTWEQRFRNLQQKLSRVKEVVKGRVPDTMDTLVQQTESPFTAEVLRYPLPTKFRMPQVEAFSMTREIQKGNANSGAFNEKQGIEKLAKMIILHDYPLSMVEHRGFRDFTTTIQPLFKCPCRNTMKKHILNIYGEERDKVMKLIENNDSRVAITTDMWTSSNQKRGFMSVTTHFIDKSWTLHSLILRYNKLTCSFLN